jgi:hypothetical protein
LQKSSVYDKIILERFMTCSFSKELSASGITSVENTFILEYLPVSDGNAVKVYLYGLFLCKNPDNDLFIEDVATKLNLSKDEILSIFSYWEEFGL